MNEYSTNLWGCVGHIKVMQGDILDDLFLLVDIALRQRHILFRLKVKFGSKGVRATLALEKRQDAHVQN